MYCLIFEQVFFVENWLQISACFGLMLVAKNMAFPNFLSKERYKCIWENTEIYVDRLLKSNSTSLCNKGMQDFLTLL